MKYKNSIAFLLISINAAWSSSMSGAYIGAFLGGAGGSHITTLDPIRLDIHTFWFQPFERTYSYNTQASFTGGGTLGYNWQFKSSYLLGLEAEYGYLNEHEGILDPNQIPYEKLPNDNIYNVSNNYTSIGNSYGYALIGGRLAYVYNDIVLYFKPAAVFTEINSKFYSVKTKNLQLIYLNIDNKKNISGYALGAGIEYPLPFKNLTAKLEYLYLGIDSNIAAAGICTGDHLHKINWRINGINTGKFGLNYKFNY